MGFSPGKCNNSSHVKVQPKYWVGEIHRVKLLQCPWCWLSAVRPSQASLKLRSKAIWWEVCWQAVGWWWWRLLLLGGEGWWWFPTWSASFPSLWGYSSKEGAEEEESEGVEEEVKKEGGWRQNQVWEMWVGLRTKQGSKKKCQKGKTQKTKTSSKNRKESSAKC